MGKLTMRQMQVLEFIREQINLTGSAPARWEIARALSFKSVHAVEECLHALAAQGAIKLNSGGQRIQVLEIPRDVSLPVVGRLPEGQAAPHWLKGMLQALTQAPPPREVQVQQSLF